MDGTSQRNLEPAPVDAEDALVVGIARHRRHRFPARTESVRARYDRDELAVVAAAAARAGMTASGYVAATALAVASNSRPPDASGDRELLVELLQARLAVRRYAVNVNRASPPCTPVPEHLCGCSKRPPDVIGPWTGWTS